jgi:hypothetical protein
MICSWWQQSEKEKEENQWHAVRQKQRRGAPRKLLICADENIKKVYTK